MWVRRGDLQSIAWSSTCLLTEETDRREPNGFVSYAETVSNRLWNFYRREIL